MLIECGRQYFVHSLIMASIIHATHSDADHTKGFLNILADPKIAVKRFYHNGLFRRTDKRPDTGPHKGNRVYGLIDRPTSTDSSTLTPLMKKPIRALEKAEAKLPGVVQKMKDLGRRVDMPQGGFVCERLDAAQRFLPPYDEPQKPLLIEVLWPRATLQDGKPSYPWYENAGKTVNGNSIVLCVRHGNQRVLLTGDLNTDAMDDLLIAYPTISGMPHALEAHVYKAAHHGRQDFSVPFLQTVKPDAAVISSGDDRNDIHGHPRAVLLGTVTRYSRCEKPAVFSTELAACFTRLSKKEQAQFKSSKAQLYERSIQGIVHYAAMQSNSILALFTVGNPPEILYPISFGNGTCGHRRNSGAVGLGPGQGKSLVSNRIALIWPTEIGL